MSDTALQKTNTKNGNQTYAPAVDVLENKEEILVLADMPGVPKDQLSVHVEKNLLAIEGKPADAQGIAPFTYKRSFTLPFTIDADQITAELTNGVLKVKLPKPPTAKPRQIPIKAS